MHALNGFIYLEMQQAIWGLPQAGILANKLLCKQLLPHGYYECANTPGLWRHATPMILFMLVVDNFGVNYVNQDNITHLIKSIKQHYEVTKDWAGDLYCGIKLNWNYNMRTLDILMPGYIKELLLKNKHCMPNQPQHCPYSPLPKQYGAKAQTSIPVDVSQSLSPEEIKESQQVVGSILYYAHAMDITVLMALSSIAIEQTKGTTNTMKKAKQLLDYLAINPKVTIWYQASNMIMNVHSDASYLSEPDMQSCTCGHFFMGLTAKDSDPIKLNGAFFYLVCHPKMYCCMRRRSQTRRTFLELQRRHHFPLDTGRIGPPAAQNTGPLQ
jgi:hypothetical protein